MKTSASTLDRLHAADPVNVDGRGHSVLEADAVRDRILATPRPARSRALHRRNQGGHGVRYALLGAVGAVAAAALVAVTLVGPGGPGSTTGPSVASASELLHQTATVARGDSDYVLTGTQRVYAGYLQVSGDDIASGEWWVKSDGSYLARTRTYSGAAARVLGVPVGHSDLMRSTKPTRDNGEPKQWTYAELRALPTDPAALNRWMQAEIAKQPLSPDAPESVTNPTARTLAMSIDLITQRLAPPTLRGAGLDVIAGLPGVVRLGVATDRLGRRGDLIAIPNRLEPAVQDTLLVDPAGGVVLETTTGAATVTAPPSPSSTYNGPTGSATFASSVRTYVGPTVVPRKLVVPDGVTVAPR